MARQIFALLLSAMDRADFTCCRKVGKEAASKDLKPGSVVLSRLSFTLSIALE